MMLGRAAAGSSLGCRLQQPLSRAVPRHGGEAYLRSQALHRLPAPASAGPLVSAGGGCWLLGRRDFSSAPPNAAKDQKNTQYFGMEWFTGRRPTETNAQMIELPKAPFDPKPYKLDFAKYPGIASGLGAEYYYREGQRSPVTYYHMRGAASGDTVCVGATDSRARETRTIDNFVKERTRGYAVQLVLEGRGVKAYFEPKFPNLMVRLGVGAKVKDLTEYCLRDPDVEVHVSKKGDLVVISGPNKARVGTLAYRLLMKMQPVLLPYTGKGAHVAHHPVRRKAVRKK